MKLCLATLSQDGRCRFYSTSAHKADNKQGTSQNSKPQLELLEDWDIIVGDARNLRTLSWSKSWNADQEPIIAIGADNGHGESNTQNCLKIYYLNTEKNESNSWKWTEILDKLPINKPSSAIHDVCFANTSGRSYHLLAIASDDGTKLLKISQYEKNEKPAFKITDIKLDDSYFRETFSTGENSQSTMGDVSSRQVSFNSNGTVLTSTTSSGEILVYQYEPHAKNGKNRWIGVHREKIN